MFGNWQLFATVHTTLLCKASSGALPTITGLLHNPGPIHMRTIVTFRSSLWHNNRRFLAVRTIVFSWQLAVFRHEGPPAVTCWPTMWPAGSPKLACWILLHLHQHLLARLCRIFTSIACWTFLHLKVSNWTVYFNCSRFLGLSCLLSYTNSTCSQANE